MRGSPLAGALRRLRPGDAPRRLTALRLYELPEGRSRRGARMLRRIGPAHRDVPEIPVHGAHELVKTDRVTVPPSYVARLRGALVAGVNSGVVFGSSFVVPGPDHLFALHPLLFEEFLTGEGDTRTLRDNPTLRADRRHGRGILITSRFTHNWFHFAVEALQALVLADGIADDAPLVIDARIPRQARELLELVAPAREILAVPPGEFWRFDELLHAVCGAYAPDVPELAPLATYETRFLPEVRARLLAAVPADGARDQILYVSRRRYLAANAGRPFVQNRDVVNSLELEEHVESLGGRVLFPEELTAAEQVAAFRSARIVVAPTGSAVADAVFCEPGTAWITLHQNRLVNPWYFANLAPALGLRWHAAVGPAVAGGHAHPLHSNYEIPVATLHAAIEAAAAGGVSAS